MRELRYENSRSKRTKFRKIRSSRFCDLLLAKKGYDPLLGARPLRRCIQREIEDVLSEKILFGDLKAAEIILVGTATEDEKEIFTFKGMPKTEMPDSPGHLAEAPTPN